MSTSSSINAVARTNNTWLHRWIYPLVAGFMFVAVFWRAFLIFQEYTLLGKIVILLLVLPFIFLGSSLLANKSPWASILLIGLEMLGILSLILLTSRVFAFSRTIAASAGMLRHFWPRPWWIMFSNQP